MRSVAVIGTFDTKGKENAYLIEILHDLGLSVISIDAGIKHEPPFVPTYPAEIIAKAGGGRLSMIRNDKLDRSSSLEIMCRGVRSTIRKLCDTDQIKGVIAMGGGQGTWLAASAMREVPIGIPKVLISTIATIERLQNRFEGINDTMVINSLVDIAGLNSILRMLIQRGAAALNGMISINERKPFGQDIVKKRIALTMWGVTTPCVVRIQESLENSGYYETIVFHATGMGGPIMEHLVAQGYFDLIADITLPEITIPLAGGEYPNDSTRLLNAARKGIPQIIAPGGVDMVETPLPIPEKFSGRKVYFHNPDLAFVRSSIEENISFGEEIASRLNKSIGPVTVILPLKGLSANDCAGGVFYDPQADEALFKSLKDNLSDNITVFEVDAHINDREFADFMAEQIRSVVSTGEDV